MAIETDKSKIRKKNHHSDPWKDNSKWTKMFFYFLVFIAGILVATAVYLVVTGN